MAKALSQSAKVPLSFPSSINSAPGKGGESYKRRKVFENIHIITIFSRVSSGD